eukprot:scaffold438_cov250-Pinguiococcus_pyrenoidosus.AAC.16
MTTLKLLFPRSRRRRTEPESLESVVWSMLRDLFKATRRKEPTFGGVAQLRCPAEQQEARAQLGTGAGMYCPPAERSKCGDGTRRAV